MQIVGTILLAILVTAGQTVSASAATVASKTTGSRSALATYLNPAVSKQTVYSDPPFSPYVFTPERSTFSGTDSDGRLEASYNFHTSPGTFGWRYEVNPAICAGGTGATAISNIYNKGGLVPNTHYAKTGVTPCYGFHSSFANSKINTKGQYQLRGTIQWRDGDATLTLTFAFAFRIAIV
jgi:hypothetical protein